jgi:hypothetical protein
MAFTDTEICSNALIRLGADPIQSFTEGTDIATTCGTIYKMKKEFMLAAYPWRFTKKYIQLSRLTAPPTAQWTYQFNLPADRLTAGLPAVYSTGRTYAIPVQEYTIVGNVLMSHHPELWVQYQATVDESLWAPYFVELMTYVMMDELCFYVTDNASLKQQINLVAYGPPSGGGVGGIYGKAMNLDSRDNPTTMVLDSVLLEARFGGTGY